MMFKQSRYIIPTKFHKDDFTDYFDKNDSDNINQYQKQRMWFIWRIKT